MTAFWFGFSIGSVIAIIWLSLNKAKLEKDCKLKLDIANAEKASYRRSVEDTHNFLVHNIAWSKTMNRNHKLRLQLLAHMAKMPV